MGIPESSLFPPFSSPFSLPVSLIPFPFLSLPVPPFFPEWRTRPDPKDVDNVRVYVVYVSTKQITLEQASQSVGQSVGYSSVRYYSLGSISKSSLSGSRVKERMLPQHLSTPSAGATRAIRSEALCNWKQHGGLFYQNRLQKLAFCRSTGIVRILLDAYGESDLRAASRTTLVRGVEGEEQSVIRLRRRSLNLFPVISPSNFEYRVQGVGHHLCVLDFPLSAFEPRAKNAPRRSRCTRETGLDCDRFSGHQRSMSRTA